MSDDSEHYAYIEPRHEKQRVILDGKPDAEYDNISDLAFDPGGRRLAYKAFKDGQPVEVADGEAGAASTGRVPSGADLGLTADGKRSAHSASAHGRTWVVQDGREGPEYDSVEPAWPFEPCYGSAGRPAGGFSPDGRRFAYVAINGAKSVLVLDGQEVAGSVVPTWIPGRFAFPHTFAFSADGKRFAYATSRAEFTAVGGPDELLLVDGQPVPSEGVHYIDQLIFSPDGGRLAGVAAYVDADGKWRYSVVVDGQASPKYDELRTHGEGSVESPDCPIASLLFNPGGTLRFLVKKADSIYRVEFAPAS